MTDINFLYTLNEIPEPSNMKRDPVRPLEEISAIAATELPQRIAEGGAEKLRNDAEHIIGKNRSDFLDRVRSHGFLPTKNTVVGRTFTSRDQAKIGLLDCAMIEAAITAGGAEPGPHLRELTDTTAPQAFSMPGLTYEGLVHSNPEGDPRIFMPDKTGQHELFFYRIHRQIEFVLARTVGLLATSLNGDTDMPLCTQRTKRCLERIQEGFNALKAELPRETFNAFRPYFTNAHRGQPGPSALFSAGMVALDTLLAGTDPDMQRFNAGKLRQRQGYAQNRMDADQDLRYSFCGNDDIVIAEGVVSTHGSDYLHDRAIPLQDRIDVASSMTKTRAMHMGVLTTFLPEMKRQTDKPGTGGQEHVLAFVEAPRLIYKNIADSLSTPL